MAKHPIRKYLEENDLTQVEFADRMGYKQGFISSLINGGDVCGRKAAIRIMTKTGGKIQLEELIMWELGDRG